MSYAPTKSERTLRQSDAFVKNFSGAIVFQGSGGRGRLETDQCWKKIRLHFNIVDACVRPSPVVGLEIYEEDKGIQSLQPVPDSGS